jgi:phage terminase large subunit-like protein
LVKTLKRKSKRTAPATSEFYFDERAAVVACNFFERLLHHSKGEWSGRPFTLLDWQKRDIIRPLFGWKRKSDGTRRYRTAYIEIPRKNGKSTLSAGIALCLLYADGEPAAEVYSAAADRDQASIVFDEAKRMVDASPELSKRSGVFKRSIFVNETLSSYKVLSADAPTKHGLNASGIIFDELHAQPNRDLWDVLTTSTGARRQPLTVAITTAGYDRQSICFEQHEYARQVLAGIIDDPSYFAYIAAADEKDDWTAPATWRKSNPSLGHTVKLDYLEQECRKAQASPAYQNTFRRLHLNQWTQQETRWLDISAWDRCADPFDAKLLDGAQCYGGLDLASSSDIASFVLCFPNESGEDELYTLLPFFWIPADNMVERARRDRVPYDAWVRDGLVRATPGNVIDYGFIVRDIAAMSEQYNIKEIAFDRWGAFQVSQQLDGAGLTMIGFGQGFNSMSPPSKDLLRLVMDGKLRHGGNAVLRWMADNVVVTTDPAGNIKPNKQKSREKIDGIVASIMALDRAVRHAGASVYDARGVLTL